MSVLLVHGIGGRPRSWNGVLAQLDPTLRTEAVAVDITVAAGESLAEVARRLLDDHPGSHVLVGHSFGGMLAQEAALMARSRVRGLVLVSSIPGATPRVAAINAALAADIEVRGLEAVAVEFAAGLFAPGRLALSPELGAGFVTDMLDAGVTSVCAALRAIANWDATERLPTLRCPAAVLAGDAEPDLDRQASLAELVGGTFDVLDGTGHLAPLERPERVARTIEGLASRLG